MHHDMIQHFSYFKLERQLKKKDNSAIYMKYSSTTLNKSKQNKTQQKRLLIQKKNTLSW